MGERHEVEAASDDLFAAIENRLHGESRRKTAPTAVLRLKAAIADVADAEACLAALGDLRSLFRQVLEERDGLSERCRLLEAVSRDPGAAEIGAVLSSQVAGPGAELWASPYANLREG